MATAQAAVDSARTFLNDVAGQFWTDDRLIAHLKEAYRDLIISLEDNQIPIIKEKTSSAITVAIGALTLTLPADFLLPIKLKERLSGSSLVSDYTDMTEREWEPDVAQESALRVWSFREGAINFVGATTTRQVLLFYWKTLSVPTAVADQLIFNQAEMYLGPKTAEYAARSLGNITLAEECLSISGTRLEMVIATNVKNQQGLPARRIPYGFRNFARARRYF